MPYLALGLVGGISVLSPERIVTGGGVVSRPQLLPLVRQEVVALMNGYLDAALVDISTYITPPALGSRAGVLGGIAAAETGRWGAALASALWNVRHTFGAEAFHTRFEALASVGCMATKVATPWGPATLVDELTLAQRAGDKRFASVVQLLEGERGERLVRFAYTTGGAARRGPVTLRARDLERLRTALGKHPGVAEALGFGGGDA